MAKKLSKLSLLYKNKLGALLAASVIEVGTSIGYDLGLPTVMVDPKTPPRPDRNSQYTFSDVYQREVPNELIEAGIEAIDADAGKAILNIHATMQFASSLKRPEDSYCGLDLQDHVLRSNQRLGQYVDTVDRQSLVGQVGENNALVKVVDEASRRFEGAKDRKSHFETLLEKNDGDYTATMNRYMG